MARISPAAILGLVMAIIFLTVFLSVANSIIPTGAASYHNLSDTLSGINASGVNSETAVQVYGSGAADFAENTDDYIGWFWVIGPFALVITLVLGVFMKKKGRY